jgi:hypothetical protein
LLDVLEQSRDVLQQRRGCLLRQLEKERSAQEQPQISGCV